MTYRIIRASADYGLVIAVTPEDTSDIENAKYYRCATWQINDQTPDRFHEISFFAAMGYFSGHADGLGYGILPLSGFASLEEALIYCNAQRSKTPSALKETPTTRFYLLLREAQTALQEVDDFDVHSDDPESVVMFHELLAEQRRAAIALIRHCQRYGDVVIKDELAGTT